MRQIRTINLIAFCALVLFIDNICQTESHSVKDYLKQFKNLRHGILPGTLWCGRGNIANNDSELGLHSELDACCRTHDRCKDYINPKTTKYQLYNKHICRSSLCECDLQFYNCLTEVQGLYASTVGRIYFKKCKQCFRTYYDPQECIKEGLNIIEDTDREGYSVFCAKYDRNPKWRHRHKISPKSIYVDEEFLTWPDDGAEQLVS